MRDEKSSISSDLLFRQMQAAFPDESYPRDLGPVPSLMDGLSFFPAGRGLYQPNGSTQTPTFPHGGVMVVGRDFGTHGAYVQANAERGERESDPTWNHLLTLLDEAGCDPRSCFFSNAFMGLRKGNQARNVGDTPAHRDKKFLAACRDFFIVQLEMMRPRVLLTLGSAVPAFVATKLKVDPSWSAGTLKAIDVAEKSIQTEVAVPELDFTVSAVVALTHPCMRPVNVRLRQYDLLRGRNAEKAMLMEALVYAGLQPATWESSHDR